MGGCSQSCREEFRARNFLLGHDNPQTFVQFQCGQQKLYVAWRIFWALYHTTWIIVSGVDADRWAGPDSSNQVKWFIYLTDWAYFALTVAAIVDAVVVVYVIVRRSDIRKGQCESMPWYLKADWVLFNISNSISITMSLAYWSLVFDGDEMSAVNIATHILNSVYVIVNVLVTGVPVRLLHFWHPVVFAIVYILFSLFYYLAGGTNHNGNPYIYKPLDWRETGTAVLYCLVVGLVAAPLIHGICFLLHSLKLLITGKCCPGTQDSDTELTERKRFHPN